MVRYGVGMTPPRQAWTSIREPAVGAPTEDGIRVEVVLSSDPGWRVAVEVDTTGAEATITSLCFERADEAGIALRDRSTGDLITSPASFPPASLLRSLKMTELVDAVNFHLMAGRRRQRVPDPLKQSANRPLYFATWAAAYVDAVRSSPRAPIAELARRYDMERPQVRDLIHLCRAKGYLTAGAPGVGGGQLTQQAVDELGRKPR